MAQQDGPDKVLNHAVNRTLEHPALARLYQIESRRFALWLPVGLGAGIWLYFDAASEPSWFWALLGAMPLGLLVAGLARRAGWAVLATCWFSLSIATGFGAATLSAHMADAPVIRYPIGETVEGRVLGISRSASGAPRLLLDAVTIHGMEPDETPARVRLTLLGDVPDPMPVPGQRVRVYANLLPAGEPVEPGAFDFRRRAFFERLGGIGLARGEVMVIPAGEVGIWDGARIALARLRDRISRNLREALPGREGAFAAAIIVGDRADIEEADAEALRASNLAHLLAISGLHMGMLTGLVYALVRLILALLPWVVYRVSTKKAAAVAALLAGAAYLALSGATVATQRAFIMVAFAFLAVLADRPAITLRALALAATVILLLRPISLLDAGFQMSFAATVALVAGYEALRHRTPRAPRGGLVRAVPRLLAIYVAGLLLSSLLAGLATAPIAAYHFNRTAPFGLLSNLLALPVMGFWIAPCACLAAVLAPLGLAGPALQAMGAGIEVVLQIAHWVGGLPGAVQPVRAAPGIVLGLVAVGGLWLALWRGPWRFAGPIAVIGALVLWSNAPPRPDVLVAPGARLVGVMGPTGRILDHERAQSFAAKTWLRRDGDWAGQKIAAARKGLRRDGSRMSAKLKDGWRLEVLWRRKLDPARIADHRRERTILIARNGPPVSGPCTYFGGKDLKRSGALAFTIEQGALVTKLSRTPGECRLWTPSCRREVRHPRR